MKNRDTKLSFVEKSIFFLGIAILIALFAYLFVQIITNENSHAKLTIRIEPQKNTPLVFRAIVKNEGEQTAESISLNFTLYDNGKPVGTTSASVSYIPVHSESKIWIIFPGKVQYDSLSVSSITFHEP